MRFGIGGSLMREDGSPNCPLMNPPVLKDLIQRSHGVAPVHPIGRSFLGGQRCGYHDVGRRRVAPIADMNIHTKRDTVVVNIERELLADLQLDPWSVRIVRSVGGALILHERGQDQGQSDDASGRAENDTYIGVFVHTAVTAWASSSRSARSPWRAISRSSCTH